jgi:ABC-type multidrug transport system fused ATPase/permease subunit
MDDCFQDILLNSLNNKKGILIITFFSLYMAGVQTLNSFLVGKIVDKQKILYLFFYVCLAISGYIINYFLDININNQVYDYSNSFFSRFMNIFFNADFNKVKEHNEVVITKVNDTVTHIRYFTESMYFSFFWRILMIIISIIIFFKYLPTISAVIIFTLIFIFIYLKIVIRELDKKWLNYTTKLHEFDSKFQNVMLNIWNIKYNSLEYPTYKSLKKTFENKSEALKEFKDMDFYIYKGPSIIFLITVIMNLYFIISKKDMEISIRVFLILQVFQMSRYIENLSGILVDKYQNVRNIQKICPVWLLEPKNSKNIKIKKINKIEFKNVNYSFGDGRGVLHNFNLIIKSGDIISLNGDSGKGKSTLINLICRLYDVNGGEILINDINIKDIDLVSLRNYISVVPQNIILFDTSIKDNIIMDMKFDKKKFNRLIKLLKIQNINKLGTELSHGQKQRVLIARTLYNSHRDVYIFDECLSALDKETATKINDYILNFLKKNKKIGIFISHNKEFEKKRGKLIKI